MTIVSLIDKLPQSIKFVIIGGIAACVHFLVVILFVELLNLNPLIANIIAFLVAFCFSFSGQRLFTFASSNKSIKES